MPGWVTDGPFALLTAAYVWLLIVLMVAPNGFQYAALVRPVAGGGLPTNALFQLIVFGSGVCILVWRMRLALLLVRFVNPLLLVFYALVLASAAWSMFPTTTITRFVRLSTILIGCLGFVLMGWHHHRFQTVLRAAISAFLLGSLLFGVLAPDIAIHQSERDELLGAWRGLTSQKNQLGSIAAVGILLWVHAWAAREVPRWHAVLGFALSMTLLLLSRSSTSLMVAVFGSVFIIMLLRMPSGWRGLRPVITVLFTAVVVAYSLVVVDKLPGGALLLKPVGVLTGKDMSFTGRTPIWDVMYDQIDNHKLKGIGYGAYWMGIETYSPAAEMALRVYFYPGSAHNGYLDILNELGIVGLAVVIGFLLLYVMQAITLFRREASQGALYLAIAFQQGLGNLSESYILYYQSVHTVILVLAALCMARSHLEYRLRHYFGTPAKAAATPAPQPTAEAMPRPRFAAKPLEWERP